MIFVQACRVPCNNRQIISRSDAGFYFWGNALPVFQNLINVGRNSAPRSQLLDGRVGRAAFVAVNCDALRLCCRLIFLFADRSMTNAQVRLTIAVIFIGQNYHIFSPRPLQQNTRTLLKGGGIVFNVGNSGSFVHHFSAVEHRLNVDALQSCGQKSYC